MLSARISDSGFLRNSRVIRNISLNQESVYKKRVVVQNEVTKRRTACGKDLTTFEKLSNLRFRIAAFCTTTKKRTEIYIPTIYPYISNFYFRHSEIILPKVTIPFSSLSLHGYPQLMRIQFLYLSELEQTMPGRIEMLCFLAS